MEISCRVYRPRRFRESPLYVLVERHLEELLRVWPTRFVRSHGPLRPAAKPPPPARQALCVAEHGDGCGVPAQWE